MKVETGKPISYELSKIIKEFVTNKDYEEIAKELGLSHRTVNGLIYNRANVTDNTKEAPILMLKKAMMNKSKLEKQTKEEIEEYRAEIKERKKRLRRMEKIKFEDRRI